MKFNVKLRVVEEYEVEIEADDACEAENQVFDNWCAGQMPCFKSETDFTVKEIK